MVLRPAGDLHGLQRVYSAVIGACGLVYRKHSIRSFEIGSQSL